MHPSRRQLEGFVFGTLAEEQVDQVADHVEQCPACDETVRELEAKSDTYVSDLRKPTASDPFAQEADCARAVALVEKMQYGKPLTTDRHEEPADTNTDGLEDIGPYRILEEVGVGGMGRVYKALHTKLEKLVALKILPEKWTEDVRAIARFEREMKAVGRIEHPNIVRATDAGEVDGRHFLVMEYVVGTDLSRLLKHVGPLRVADACEIVRQAAVGLEAVRQSDLVHRDIKPSNLMLIPAGEIKILDLGLALLESGEDDQTEISNPSTVMGTADYMAPEQGLNTHQVDIRADLYSLGCTLFALLIGHAPFSRQQFNSPLKVMLAHQKSTPPDIRELREEVPPELALVVERLLAKSPDDRYATPLDVAAALEPFAVDHNLRELAAASQPQDVSAALPSATDNYRSSPLTGTAGSRSQPQHQDTTPSADHEPVSNRSLSETAPHGGPSPAIAAQSQSKWKNRTPYLIAAAFAGILLLGVIFSVRTREGLLVIETDDPNIEVAVEQGGKLVTVLDEKSGWNIRLADGQYDLSVGGAEDRFELSQNRITVHRGNEVRLKVTLQDKKLAANDAVPQASTPPVPEKTEDTRASTETLVGGSSAGGPTIAQLDEAVKNGGVVMEIGEWQSDYGTITPDSSHVAIAAADGGVQMVDFFTHEVVATIDAAQPPLTFSHDGRKMAATIDQEHVGEWDWRTGELLATHDIHTNGFLQLTYMPSGDIAVLRVNVLKNNVFELVTPADPIPRQFIGHRGEVQQAKLSQRGDLIVSRSGAEYFTWTANDAAIISKPSVPHACYGMLFPDGDHFYISGDKILTKYEAQTGNALYSMKQKPRFDFGPVVLSHNQTLGAYVYNNNLYIFDPQSGADWKGLLPYFTHNRRFKLDNYKDISMSRDGHFVLCHQHLEFGDRPTLRLFRLPTCPRPVPLVAASTPTPDGFLYGDDIGCTHVYELGCASMSKDGRFVTEVGPTLAIYDAMTGKYVRRFDTSVEKVGLRDATISSDGQFLLCCRYSNGTILTDSTTGRVIKLARGRSHDRTPLFLAGDELFSDVVESKGNASICRVADGKAIGALVYPGTHGKFTCRAASANGLHIAAGTESGFIYLWRIPADWREALSAENPSPIEPYRAIVAHSGPVSDVVFRLHDEELLSCSSDRTIAEWEPSSGTKRAMIEELSSEALSLAVDAAGRIFAGHADGVLRIWDSDTAQPAYEFHSHTRGIDQLAVLEDGTRAVTYSSASGDGTTRFWKLPPPGSELESLPFQGEIRRIVWQRPNEEVISASLLPSAEQAITVHQDTKDEEVTSIIRVWDIEGQSLVRELQGHTGSISRFPVRGLAVSPDEKFVAVADETKVFVWEVSQGRLLHAFASSGPVAFTPDSKVLLSGGHRSDCFAWDLATGEQLAEANMREADDTIWQHATLDNAGLVASYSPKKGFFVWNWATADEQLRFGRDHFYSDRGLLGRSDSGKQLVTRTRSNLQLVDARTGITKVELAGHGTYGYTDREICFIQYLKEGRFLLSGGVDMSIRLWDAQLGRQLYQQNEHLIHRWHHSNNPPPVFAAAITLDMEHLLSVAGDGTIRKFRLPSRVIKLLQARPDNTVPRHSSP